MLTVFLLFWVIMPICIAIVANHKGFNAIGWLIYGFFLWPIALVHVLVASPTQEEMNFRAYDLGKDKCLFCAEWISNEAKVCRYCHKELPENWANEQEEMAK